MDPEDEYTFKFFGAIILIVMIIIGAVQFAKHINPKMEQRELLDSLKEENLRLEIELKKQQLK